MPVVLLIPIWLVWTYDKMQLNEAIRKANLS